MVEQIDVYAAQPGNSGDVSKSTSLQEDSIVDRWSIGLCTAERLFTPLGFRLL